MNSPRPKPDYTMFGEGFLEQLFQDLNLFMDESGLRKIKNIQVSTIEKYLDEELTKREEA